MPADQGNQIAELQFSLFVALSDLADVDPLGENLPVLLRLIQGYLHGVASDDAQAAWMVGFGSSLAPRGIACNS